ncbi:hypothetical protein [Nitrococcus mobilis]|uniref:Uncharacterized protein n=1 Tax=Nitrococcus mobilis Nb-231 TaxID=314278 RepID=A4BR17_9GAMM|nr:hypothetical protein [Nitrococcus mobilis]EAR22017.1 hypothetical protein NB231_06501 [Nitrococcus mobilis Nb-231]
MNEFLASAYTESVHRLALGLEPLDALRGGRLAHPVRVELERPLPRHLANPTDPYRRPVRPGDVHARVNRHDSALHVLLYHPSLADHVDLRIYDHVRRYVPRRFRLPLLSQEVAESQPYTHRVRRPVLFPGAAYDVSERATGLRGRVLRSDKPMRWARIEAWLPDTETLVGRAQGDDRGEFLLLLAPGAAPASEFTGRDLEVRVDVFGPETPPAPIPTDLPDQDPFWDLSLELAPTPGEDDPVSAGGSRPEGYVAAASASRIVSFRLGRLRTGIEEENFVFTLP